MVFVERSRYTDNDGIHLFGVGIFVGRPKPFGSRGGNLSLRNPVNIRPAVVQGFYLFRVNIESGYGKAGFIEEQCQRQAYIAKADDADFCRSRLNATEQLI
jgi:hypothetical protein